MIIVKLIGGLGNQMFQYALGRKMALQLGEELLLDCSFFSEKGSHTPRQYELDVFEIEARKATEDELRLFQPKNRSRMSNTLHRLLNIQSPYKIIRENGHQFQPDVLYVKGHAHFIGYWQSEKYFLDIRKNLLQDFQYKKVAEGINAELMNQISHTNAVSLHIRRGDYVTNSAANVFHGLCDLDYYHRAIDYLKTAHNDISFFIFSDDIAWAKENLEIEFPTIFIDHNKGMSSFEDLRLMSACRHHIIANSSFSWWGAWLNPREDKTVIGPQKWFLDPMINTKDVLPDNWIKL